jgi:hypothetical protein
MAEPCIVRDYAGLVECLRRRAEELDVSRMTLDDVAGLPSGLTGKILGGAHVKKLGRLSLGGLLGALGLELVVRENPDALERVRRRLEKRK